MNAPVLALIDVLDHDGHARHSLPVHADADGQALIRIGRALDADLVLDDPQVAAHHAEVHINAQPGGQLRLLPSRNGARVGRRHHDAGASLAWPHDGVLQVGHTRLRLRHAAGPLAPEAALAPLVGRWSGLILTGVLAVLALASTLWETWLAATPETPWTLYGGAALGVTFVLAAWAGGWALLNQLFQRRFPLGQHLRLALVGVLIAVVLENGASLLAYAYSWPAALLLERVLTVGLGLGVVWLHGLIVWPKHGLRLGALLVAGLALYLAFAWQTGGQQQNRWQPLYMSVLPPPSLRVAPLRSTDDLLKDAAALRGELARKAKMDPDTGDEDDAAE